MRDPPPFDAGTRTKLSFNYRGNRMATDAKRDTGSGLKELTLRGILLGAVLTVLFTAANVYLGLRIGITFATSIPAAVISMAILKLVRDGT